MNRRSREGKEDNQGKTWDQVTASAWCHRGLRETNDNSEVIWMQAKGAGLPIMILPALRNKRSCKLGVRYKKWQRGSREIWAEPLHCPLLQVPWWRILFPAFTPSKKGEPTLYDSSLFRVQQLILRKFFFIGNKMCISVTSSHWLWTINQQIYQTHQMFVEHLLWCQEID